MSNFTTSHPNCARAALIVLGMAALAVGARADDSIPDHLFSGRNVPITYPPAPPAAHDQLVAPPGEESFFPIRADGQPFVLNVDSTVNLTAALNSFYYNPKWRGEVWSPFDQYDTPERASRMMSTWREYDEFSTLRVLNGWHKFWEKWSGYGP